jgi:hypothetical protein
MEAYLAAQIDRAPAYELRHDLINGDEVPTHHVRITLTQLYRHAGKSLQDWPLWRTWVGRLHPKLLAMTQLTTEKLATDSSLLPLFHERLLVLEKERRPAFVTFGQKDLTDSKEKVLARQERIFNRKDSKQQAARGAELLEKRRKYFPWLGE